MCARRRQRRGGRYLEHRVAVRVRFQEVDSLGVVWHGHYATYFEDARMAFGERYGLSAREIAAEGLFAPVAELSCRFLKPARVGDLLDVSARLYERESARVEFLYRVERPSDGSLLATGASVQVFTDREWRLCLTRPPVLERFYQHWGREMVEHG